MSSRLGLAAMLREWLEWYPERVPFSSDAYSERTALANREEKTWLTSRTARRALAVVLTEMMQDGEIDRPYAEKLARLVLRDNAAGLYGLIGLE